VLCQEEDPEPAAWFEGVERFFKVCKDMEKAAAVKGKAATKKED